MIVSEKERFKDKPVNFAMKKAQIMKEKEFAEMNGDHEKAIYLGKEIDRLEEESKKLEKVRTQNIASISFINERNRMRNIKEAERAIAEAAKEAQNNRDDPFTRRKCTPQMVHAVNKNKSLQTIQNTPIVASVKDGDKQASQLESSDLKTDSKITNDSSKNNLNEISKSNQSHSISSNSKSQKDEKDSYEDANDMFSVHNFDIKIDVHSLDIGLSSNGSSSSLSNQNSFSTALLSGLASKTKSNGFSANCSNALSSSGTNRRSLNLDEYKKKKGLI